MKISKSILPILICIITCTTLNSCSEDSCDITNSYSDNSNIESSDTYFARWADEFSGWNSSSTTINFPSRSSVNTLTLYGFASASTSGNKKVLIQADLANKIGISSQIYVLEEVTIYQHTTITGLGTSVLFSPANSPLCGCNPLGSGWFSIGYANSTPDESGNINFTTKCLHIISDMAGRSYDVWYPQRPLDLQWNYMLISI